jgi:hypothetical protein
MKKPRNRSARVASIFTPKLVAEHDDMLMSVLRDPTLTRPAEFGQVLHCMVDAMVWQIRGGRPQ